MKINNTLESIFKVPFGCRQNPQIHINVKRQWKFWVKSATTFFVNGDLFRCIVSWSNGIKKYFLSNTPYPVGLHCKQNLPNFNLKESVQKSSRRNRGLCFTDYKKFVSKFNINPFFDNIIKLYTKWYLKRVDFLTNESRNNNAANIWKMLIPFLNTFESINC